MAIPSNIKKEDHLELGKFWVQQDTVQNPHNLHSYKAPCIILNNSGAVFVHIVHIAQNWNHAPKGSKLQENLNKPHWFYIVDYTNKALLRLSKNYLTWRTVHVTPVLDKQHHKLLKRNDIIASHWTYMHPSILIIKRPHLCIQYCQLRLHPGRIVPAFNPQSFSSIFVLEIWIFWIFL